MPPLSAWTLHEAEGVSVLVQGEGDTVPEVGWATHDRRLTAEESAEWERHDDRLLYNVVTYLREELRTDGQKTTVRDCESAWDPGEPNGRHEPGGSHRCDS